RLPGQGRRADVVRAGPRRQLSAGSHLCRQDPQRREAGRPAGGAADTVLPPRQPQDRQGARSHDPAVAARAGRRGDPVTTRRAFLGTLAGFLAAPLDVRAQQPAKVSRIGWLLTGSLEAPETRALLSAFRQGTRERGYVEGQNLFIEYRPAEGQLDRFPALAADLVRLKVDLIVAGSTSAARAAQQATTTIPIVAPTMADPVGDGLVASLARPGGNITGLTFLGPELVTKRLGLLKQALPNVSRVAALWQPGAFGERTTRDMLQATEAAARSLAIELQLVEVRGVDE